MIEQLNVFTAGTFVNCNEWNTNFRTLNNYAEYCKTAVEDAQNNIATSTGDMTNVFNAVNSSMNSSFVINHIISNVEPENEYFDTLIQSSDQLEVHLRDNFSSSARFVIKIENDYELEVPPFTVLGYTGVVIIRDDGFARYDAGMYMLFLYEAKGQCIIKVTKTGE